jgi:hypothetical protein
LKHGAFLYHFSPLVLELLWRPSIDRDSKTKVCRLLLLNRNYTDNAASIATLDSLWDAIIFIINWGEEETESLLILLEAGIRPGFRNNQALHLAIAAKNHAAGQLLLKYGSDPLLEQKSDDDDPAVWNASSDSFPANNVDWSRVNGGGPGLSPFHTAARCQEGDTVMLEYLLEHCWLPRFNTTNNGVNDMGEFPIHAICRDKHVSLAAVQLLLMPGLALQAAEPNNDGLYPFQIATMSGASLDVVFTLYQHHEEQVEGPRRG